MTFTGFAQTAVFCIPQIIHMKTFVIQIYNALGNLVFSGKCKALSFNDARAMAELSAKSGDEIKIS